MKSKIEWFVGRWHASSGAIEVVFVISKTGKRFRIRAIEECDGKELVVSRVKQVGNVLSFETRTPSNNWRTKNRLRVISKNKAIQELTYWEPLERVR